MSKAGVLVVEDDVVMRGVLMVALRSHGYDARPATCGREALDEVASQPPDVMLLDLGLPDMDGVDVAASVRREHALPIIVLSARGDEQQQIRALDHGANDYVTKPFREGELMARIRAALRRPPLVHRADLKLGDLTIDPDERRVFVRNREVRLTPTEFKLLHILARQPGRIFTHEQIMGEVWEADEPRHIHNLRVYMRLLRNKIESDPTRPARIVTALGVGYRLVCRTPKVAKAK